MSDIGLWAAIPAVPALLAVLWGIPQHAAVPQQAVPQQAVPHRAVEHQAVQRHALRGSAAGYHATGGYPYATAPCEFGRAGGADCANPRNHGDMYDWGYPRGERFRAGDPWGYEYRNCTSYVAWQLSLAGVRPVLFSDLGNATAWIASVAGEAGVVVNRVPSPGAVAVWAVAAGVGHVAWVDSVRRGSRGSGNGVASGTTTVTVSDYNYAGTGTFATHAVTVQPTSYIHFPRRRR
ncbi:MAG TPA: CHAP domain-containing protein [Trebonia sp.]|nr:CHAP domain-containing protein [Trebonia sp.]